MAGPADTPGTSAAGASGDPAYLAFQRAALGHGTLPVHEIGTRPPVAGPGATPGPGFGTPPAAPGPPVPLIQPGQGGGSLGGDPNYLAMQRAVLGEQNTAVNSENTTDATLKAQQAAADAALAQQQKVADQRAGLTYGGRGIQNSSEAISGLANLNAGYAARQQTYDAGIANQMAALDAALNQTLAGLNTKMAEQTLTSAATQSQQAGVNGPNPYLPAGGTASSSSIVAEAQKYVGGPYQWGGGHSGADVPPGGAVDCSGLVQQVFADNGIKISGTAADMQRMGAPVGSLAQAQPGDLIFYGSPAHHVGIYIGNGQMISAQNPASGVRVSSVAGFGNDFSGIRRVT